MFVLCRTNCLKIELRLCKLLEKGRSAEQVAANWNCVSKNRNPARVSVSLAQGNTLGTIAFVVRFPEREADSGEDIHIEIHME